MAHENPIKVLLIEDNSSFAKLVSIYLGRAEDEQFDIVWKTDGSQGIAEASSNPGIDVILMDHFLPGMNGLEATKALRDKGIDIPIIFLTVSKDVDLAMAVMKAGVEDYLVKEEITTPLLPKTLLAVVEKKRVQRGLAELEIGKKRLEAMQELIVDIAAEIGAPLTSMQMIVAELVKEDSNEQIRKYLTIIKENVERIHAKMEKLKNLKEDKTIQYIKDIRMVDLS